MTDLKPEYFMGGTADEILQYVKKKRWFGQKSLEPRTLEIVDIVPLNIERTFFIVIARIGFSGNMGSMYSLPVSLSLTEDQTTMAHIHLNEKVHFLQDAFYDAGYTGILVRDMADEKEFSGLHGSVVFRKTEFFTMPEFRSFETIKSEQSNSSSVVDNSMIMKNYRYLQDGGNPDLEMALALATGSEFRNVPKPMGYAVYQGKNMKLYITAASEFLAGSVDAWSLYTLTLKSLIEKNEDYQSFRKQIIQLGAELGELTGRMHESLSSIVGDQFRPESLDQSDLEEIARGSIEYTTRSFDLLKSLAGAGDMSAYMDRIEKIYQSGSLKDVAERMISGISVTGLKKIRIHGDYHLGQILKWKNAFYIIDFEGEPIRPIEERRKKQSPMKDLAGIIRSMDYLVSHVIMETGFKRIIDEKNQLMDQVRKNIIESYKNAFKSYGRILPVKNDMFNLILDLYMLDKSSYELLYEINNRPSWIGIPLNSVMNILESVRSQRGS